MEREEFMMIYSSFLKNFTKSEQIYVILLIFTGIVSFVYNINFPVVQMEKWVYIYLLAISVIVLSHWTIMSPQGNNFSTDSCIYLFSIVALGLEITLCVAFLVFLYDLTLGKNVWWRDLLNFNSYTVMICSSFYIYIFTGGEVGGFNFQNILPYVFSILTYAALNILIIGFFLSMIQKERVLKTLQNMLNNIFATYMVVLFLSFILNILISSQGFFGLFIFLSVCLLLSTIFKKYFDLYQSVYEKSNKDHLTDLYNHGYFKQLLEELMEDSKKEKQIFSIAMLDLDDFKKYNDTHGHLNGDKLLKFFGHQMEKACSEKDYIVARYGGEEFALLMPNTNPKKAYNFLNAVRKQINDTYFEGVEVLPYGCISFSGGITESGSCAYSASELISKADEAMYYAKAQGKNNIHIYEDGSYLQESINLENDLHLLEQQLQIFLSKDIYTYRHSKRVFKYACEFSDILQLSVKEKRDLIRGALIHDIGKLEVPRDIINKKGKLDAHEWEIIKKHVTWGKEILATNKNAESLLPLVELHHERFDGKGYPYGLKEYNIPKLARILCLIDSFDAMTTERPYQRTKTFEEAFSELRKCAGHQFDPVFIEPFIKMVQNSNMDTKEEEISV